MDIKAQRLGVPGWPSHCQIKFTVARGKCTGKRVGSSWLVSEHCVDPRRYSDRDCPPCPLQGNGVSPPSLPPQQCVLAGPEEHPHKSFTVCPSATPEFFSLHSGRFKVPVSRIQNGLREIGLLAQGHLPWSLNRVLPPRAPRLHLPSTLVEGCQAVLMPSCQLGPSA